MTDATPPQAAPQAALYAALAAAQGEMGHARKDARNPHFKNTYATLASTIDAVREVFPAHGLAVVQCPGWETDRVTVTTTITHAAGGAISSTCSARPVKDDPQQVGSCITYLRRYALQAMCGIASEDDDGEAASATAGRRETQPPTKRSPAREMQPTEPAPACSPEELVAALAKAVEASATEVSAWLDAVAVGWESRDGEWLALQRDRMLSDRAKLARAIDANAAERARAEGVA